MNTLLKTEILAKNELVNEGLPEAFRTMVSLGSTERKYEEVVAIAYHKSDYSCTVSLSTNASSISFEIPIAEIKRIYMTHLNNLSKKRKKTNE